MGKPAAEGGGWGHGRAPPTPGTGAPGTDVKSGQKKPRVKETARTGEEEPAMNSGLFQGRNPGAQPGVPPGTVTGLADLGWDLKKENKEMKNCSGMQRMKRLHFGLAHFTSTKGTARQRAEAGATAPWKGRSVHPILASGSCT